MSLYFWKRVWDYNTRRCFFCHFWSSIHNNYFYYQLSSLIKQLRRTGRNILLCISSWLSKVVEQQQEDDEAIIVLVFHSPNDLRHWPVLLGKGGPLSPRIYHGCFSVRSDWVVSRSGRKSCWHLGDPNQALDSKQSGNVPEKCSNVGLLLPEGKKLLCVGWTILKLFSAVAVLDYTAGKDL